MFDVLLFSTASPYGVLVQERVVMAVSSGRWEPELGEAAAKSVPRTDEPFYLGVRRRAPCGIVELAA